MNTVSHFFRNALFSVCTLILAGTIAGCGGPASDAPEGSAPPSQPEAQTQTIRVVALQVGDELSPEAFESFLTGYSENTDGVDVEFSTVTVDPSSNLDVMGAIENADLAIFPSLTHSVLRSQIEAFYPIPATEQTSALPSTLPLAYASMQEGSHWAVPLALDPVVMVMKREMPRSIGEPIPVKDWGKIRLMQNRLGDEGMYPQLVFLNQPAHALTDAAAVLSLGYGFQMNNLRSNWEETGVPVNSIELVMINEFKFMSDLITPGDESVIMKELPTEESIESFLASDALFTYVRYSEWAKVPAEAKRNSFAMVSPGPLGSSSVVYAISAAIPMTSSSPEASTQLVQALQANAMPLATAHSSLDAYSLGSNPYNLGFSAEDALLIRENTTVSDADLLLGIFQGIAELSQFTESWSTGFFMPVSMG